DLGITAGYARAVGLGSTDSGGTRVGTSWQGYDVGLRERIGVVNDVLLGLNVGYGSNAFRFDGQPDGAAGLPSVRYTFLRAGADARVAFGPISVFGGGAYLDVLSNGSDLFPRASVGGVEANVGLAYALARSFELSFALGYTRMFYSFNPVPGDVN